ncbi:hypothetical protein CSHISOI_04330 [Colletotrichum shisoi]|uniref:Uncharacterized protein n=1 Tax=Colletotrichum shisoi TaxID=2078593 RepID=A0A5Q4BX47_9PEZI|nr:hypothetical protein CSHISOI_04330 [Colletotrichum shisoi]
MWIPASVSPSLFLDHFSLFSYFHLFISPPPFPFCTLCSRRASPNGATAHAAHCATLPSPIATASQQALVKPPEVYLSHGSSSAVRTVVTLITTTPLGGLAVAAFKKSSKAGCGGVGDGGESSASVTQSQPSPKTRSSFWLLRVDEVVGPYLAVAGNLLHHASWLVDRDQKRRPSPPL